MERSVTVTGHGAAQATPDVAVLRVAIVQRAATVEKAWADASVMTSRAINVAGSLIEERRIAAHEAMVWPVHEGTGVAAQFEARRPLTIRCDSLATAGQLTDALVAGVGDALQIESLAVEVSDPSEQLIQARALAFADAAAKAAELAALAGAELGEVHQVVEGGASYAPAKRALAADAAMLPGESEQSAMLTVTWGLRTPTA